MNKTANSIRYTRGAEISCVIFGRKGAVISFPSCLTLRHGRQTVSFNVTRLATMAAESGVFGRVRVMSCAVT